MRIRLDEHLADPGVLSRIAPGLTPSGRSAEADDEQIARIDFHEAAHGRSRAGAGWHGEAPPPRLVREAASEIMACYGRRRPDEMRARMPLLLRRAEARLAARGPVDRRSEVEVLARERRYDGFYALDEYRLRHRQYGGGWSEAVERGTLISYDAVIVLPYDPASDRVLLVEQFRIGPFARGASDPWSSEPVAGLIDPGESAEETARREAREEAGLELTRLIPLGAGYTSPGASTGYHHHFIGLCEIPEAPRRGGLADEDEDIRAVPEPAETFLERLDAGTLGNAPTILCAQALRTLRPALRA